MRYGSEGFFWETTVFTAVKLPKCPSFVSDDLLFLLEISILPKFYSFSFATIFKFFPLATKISGGGLQVAHLS